MSRIFDMVLYFSQRLWVAKYGCAWVEVTRLGAYVRMRVV